MKTRFVVTSDVDRLDCSSFPKRRVCQAGNIFTIVIIVEPSAKKTQAFIKHLFLIISLEGKLRESH